MIQLVKFVDNNFTLDVSADVKNETVWLAQKEMTFLFGVNTDNIGLRIGNILDEHELDGSTTDESSAVQFEGKRHVRRTLKIYNLDMIISVGYRVKSSWGILFRKWTNKVLKEHLIQGYVLNQKRLDTLCKLLIFKIEFLLIH